MQLLRPSSEYPIRVRNQFALIMRLASLNRPLRPRRAKTLFSRIKRYCSRLCFPPWLCNAPGAVDPAATSYLLGGAYQFMAGLVRTMMNAHVKTAAGDLPEHVWDSSL